MAVTRDGLRSYLAAMQARGAPSPGVPPPPPMQVHVNLDGLAEVLRGMIAGDGSLRVSNRLQPSP